MPIEFLSSRLDQVGQPGISHLCRQWVGNWLHGSICCTHPPHGLHQSERYYNRYLEEAEESMEENENKSSEDFER